MKSIVCQEVSKRFGNEQAMAVDKVSFEVDSGDFVVLLGPSGCGKTTLLKMINRLYEPSGGQIFFEGTNILELPATQLRRQIGYVIQQVGLFPHMRIEKNIAVVPELLGWEKPRIESRVDELLELVSLPPEYRKRYPRQLSGGEQQRVGLARALAADPDVMLMDEPFAAIDAINRSSLQDELFSIQRKLHKTILFVTHDVEEALRLADRIIVMQSGKIIQYDTPLKIISTPRNAFVKDLVGSENKLRQLSLIYIENILPDIPPAQPEAAPSTRQVTIRVGKDLRSALTLLLASQVPALTVVDGEDRKLGQITFEDIRSALETPEEKMASEP